jgi:Periplasmic component of the Tol biopolymer transport system
VGKSILSSSLLSAILCTLLFSVVVYADEGLKYNAYGLKTYTIESEHFRLSYTEGLEDVAKEAGEQFEKLYRIYKESYCITLPTKTEILVVDGELTNGLAQWNLNFIVIWCHDLDFTLRGTHDWLKGVCTHEFGHIVSLWSAMKLPSWIPMVQIGDFTHPNSPDRVEAMHVVPTMTIPPWLAEGIAQYEDSRYGTDSWDSHRDMILRTLTLSNTLLSWDHMSVMTGKEDDYEKTYDHGFSLVTYIAHHYGYNKVVSLLRENAIVYRLGFDASVKAVLGISARQLYDQWKDSLELSYKAQVKKLGTQVYGRKINKLGFDNYWPKFSPNGNKIFFLSNGEEDYSFSYKSLYSYSLLDTVKEDDKIKLEKNIGGFYSIHAPSGLIAFTSRKSSKSVVAPREGGDKSFDVFIDTLPPEKKKFRLFRHKTERQVTEKKRAFTAVFSPSGNMLACAHRVRDRFYLALVDTNGKNFRIVYPDSGRLQSRIDYIYSLDWSVDGRHIAISYIDSRNRKIGIFDTLSREFSVLSNKDHDDRDPRFSADGKDLYFASDKTGIFNIYRYSLDSLKLSRLTNVSGGAFTPDISPNGKKLVFANYDEKGYSIYLVDTVKTLEESPAESLLVKRDPLPAKAITAQFTQARPYSHIPKQFLVVPTLITEEVLAKSSNVFEGQGALKAGCIVNMMDPFAMVDMGTELGGYLLLEPLKLFDFINLNKRFFNPNVNYDIGAFGTTKLFPITLSGSYLQRGIAGSNAFFDYDLGQKDTFSYGITIKDLTGVASYPLGAGFNLHLLAGYNWYDVFLNLSDLSEYYNFDLPYTLAQGYRGGAFLTFFAPAIDSKMLISPRGLYMKLTYDYWGQKLMNDNQSFKVENNLLVENYDTYRYHEFGMSLKMGMPSPWYDKHDLYFEFRGTSVMNSKELFERLGGKTVTDKTSLPSYYQPGEWIPGYTYYDTAASIYTYYSSLLKHTDTTITARDTVLITGNTIAAFTASYRFPLWPRPFDTKFWFLYFDKLYGAINFTTAAGWLDFSDIRRFNKSDWLSSAGLEARLEALSFDIPMAIKLRWDRGFNRSQRHPPIGGDRFTFSIGFSFDNWEYIDEPDYNRSQIR